MQIIVWYYRVMYEFQSESTPYSLPECQGTPCSKQASNQKFKWQEQDSNPQPFNRSRLHLNDAGISVFVRNFRGFLNNFDKIWPMANNDLLEIQQ